MPEPETDDEDEEAADSFWDQLMGQGDKAKVALYVEFADLEDADGDGYGDIYGGR